MEPPQPNFPMPALPTPNTESCHPSLFSRTWTFPFPTAISLQQVHLPSGPFNGRQNGLIVSISSLLRIPFVICLSKVHIQGQTCGTAVKTLLGTSTCNISAWFEFQLFPFQSSFLLQYNLAGTAKYFGPFCPQNTRTEFLVSYLQPGLPLTFAGMWGMNHRWKPSLFSVSLSNKMKINS